MKIIGPQDPDAWMREPEEYSRELSQNRLPTQKSRARGKGIRRNYRTKKYPHKLNRN